MKPYMNARMYDGYKYATISYDITDRYWPEFCEAFWHALLERAKAFGVNVHNATADAIRVVPLPEPPCKVRLKVRFLTNWT